MSSQDISTDRVYNMLLQDIVVNKVKACEKCPFLHYHVLVTHCNLFWKMCLIATCCHKCNSSQLWATTNTY